MPLPERYPTAAAGQKPSASPLPIGVNTLHWSGPIAEARLIVSGALFVYLRARLHGELGTVFEMERAEAIRGLNLAAAETVGFIIDRHPNGYTVTLGDPFSPAAAAQHRAA